MSATLCITPSYAGAVVIDAENHSLTICIEGYGCMRYEGLNPEALRWLEDHPDHFIPDWLNDHAHAPAQPCSHPYLKLNDYTR